MKLVKQIGFGVIVLSLCGMLGCGKSKPTAFERLRQQQAAASPAAAAVDAEVQEARTLWVGTYRKKHEDILAEMDRILAGGVPSTDPNYWGQASVNSSLVLKNKFRSSENPKIKSFMNNLISARDHLNQFAGYIRGEVPLSEKPEVEQARNKYETSIKNMDSDLAP